MEDADCSMEAPQAPPEWTKILKLNGHTVTALLDTGCTKLLVHPKYVEETDYLGWSIPYHTASNKGTYFLAARVTMELEGKEMTLALGVSKRLSEEMLMGRDIPHFKQFFRKELKKEMRVNASHATIKTEEVMMVTGSKQRQQDALKEEEQLGLEEDEAVLSISKSGSALLKHLGETGWRSRVLMGSRRTSNPRSVRLRYLERTRYRS